MQLGRVTGSHVASTCALAALTFCDIRDSSFGDVGQWRPTYRATNINWHLSRVKTSAHFPTNDVVVFLILQTLGYRIYPT